MTTPPISLRLRLLLAFGVILISLSRGMNMDVSSYMFGSILAMTQEDVLLSIGLSVVVVGLFIFFYNNLPRRNASNSFAVSNVCPRMRDRTRRMRSASRASASVIRTFIVRREDHLYYPLWANRRLDPV